MDTTESGWTYVGRKLPDAEVVVWGYDCYYHKQGPCTLKGANLYFTNGDDDSYIVLWGPVDFTPPTKEELDEALKLAITR